MVALNDEPATALSATPMAISGQNLSVLVGALPAALYAAGSSLAAGIPVNWLSTREWQGRASVLTTVGLSTHGFMCSATDLSGGALALYSEVTGDWTVSNPFGLGSVTGIAGAFNARASFIIDGPTGDLSVRIGLTVITKVQIPSFAGVLLAKSLFIAAQLGGALAQDDSYASTLDTSASNLVDPTADEDLCGNPTS